MERSGRVLTNIPNQRIIERMIDESYSTKIVVLRSSLNTPKIKAPDEFHSTKRRKK
ncbi:hypothetical protein Csa_018407, partial [Cucumis sativus]